MAVAVVHAFEVIQVEEQQADVGTVSPRVPDRVGQAAVQRAVVEEAGETVAARVPGVPGARDLAESGGGSCREFFRGDLPRVAVAPGHGMDLMAIPSWLVAEGSGAVRHQLSTQGRRTTSKAQVERCWRWR